MSFIAEDDFSMKFLIFFKLCQSTIGEVSAFQMIKWLQFLSQFNFECMQAKIFSHNTPQCRLSDAQFLRTTWNRLIWLILNRCTTAAIISSLRAIRRLYGTGTYNNVNLISNLSTIARTACRVRRLLRPKIGVNALIVATTDSEFRQ